jgi:hypothetical protein
LDAKHDRLDVARRVTRALRHRDFRSTLGKADGAPVPIVVALPQDRLGDVFKELARCCCPAVVASFTDDDEFALIHFTPGDPGEDCADHEDCQLHPETELSMLLLYLAHARGPVRCHIVNPQGELELIS